MNAYMKFAAGALLFLLWTALVWTHHADPDLIDAIKFALGSLGLYHVATNLQAATPAAPSAELIAQIAALFAQQHAEPQQPPIVFPPAPKVPS